MLRWPASVRSLGHRDYRLLWFGSILSNIGTWMQIASQAWVVYEMSGRDARWLGADAFAAGIPTLLTPLAGVAADRINRRSLIAASTIVSAVVSLFLTVMLAMGQLRIWQVLVCSFFSGLAQTFAVPAYVAYMPELVGRREMSNAIALNAAGFNVSRIIGPTLGGILLASAGAAWCFGVNALSFGALLIALAMIHTHRPEHAVTDKHPWHSLVEGFRYLIHRKDVSVMILLTLSAGVFASPTFTMLAPLAHDVLGRPEEWAYTTLLSVFGVGSLAGSMLLAWDSHRTPTPWRAFPLLIGVGAGQAVCACIPSIWGSGFVIAVMGAMVALSLARLNAAITGSTPPELRGRMISFFFMSIAGGIPVGAFIAGYMAKHWQTRETFVGFGVALMVVVLLIGLVSKSRGIMYVPSAPVGSTARA